MRIRRAFPLLFVFVLLSGCVHRLREDYTVAETVVWQENCAEIRLPLPEGWAWEYTEDRWAGRYGIRFWPEEAPEIWCKLVFVPTGIVYNDLFGENPVLFSLRSGQRAICRPHYCASTLDFLNTPGDYAADIETRFKDPDFYVRWNPAFLAILNRAELGGDWPREDNARAIASAAAGPDWEAGISHYDWLDGSWRIHSSQKGGDRWRVNADGTAECLGPPES